MISILLPTRGRPELLNRCIQSALETAKIPSDIEFIIRIDDDDLSYKDLPKIHNIKVFIGPRQNLSQCFLYEKARGPIYMIANDDIVFCTKGWDEIVIKEFEKYPDKIAIIYGDDKNLQHKRPTFPFIHKNWITVTGQLLPPYFSGDFVDTWFEEIATEIDRLVNVDIVIEHLHFAFNKREEDSTDKEKWEKHFKDDMPKKFEDTRSERKESAKKLLEYMKK
jgi:hypothetical protein